VEEEGEDADEVKEEDKNEDKYEEESVRIGTHDLSWKNCDLHCDSV
jgi:hypothetical protein